jgi:endonuclease/exonuclease/phosphatase family metal-dependent hydrolase
MDKDGFKLFQNNLTRWAVTIISIMFGLQLLRVLLSLMVGYLRDSQGIDAINLAPLALGIFSLSFLAGLLLRLVNPKWALIISTVTIGCIRLVEQISTSPSLDLYLSAIGVVSLTFFIPISLSQARNENERGTTDFGLAFILGIVADTAIHIGAGTLDLTWQDGLLPVMFIVILDVILFTSLRSTVQGIKQDKPLGANWRSSLLLLHLGPWFFLQLLVFQNVARFSALSGWDTPSAGSLIILGNVIGLAIAIRLSNEGKHNAVITFSIIILFIGLQINPEPTGIVAVISLFTGQILSIVFGLILFRGTGTNVSKVGFGPTTIANGLGWLVFVVLTFIYYITYDIDLGFRAQTLLPVAAFLASIGFVSANRGSSKSPTQAHSYHAPIISIFLLVFPIGLALAWNKPQHITPNPINDSVRIIDYNVHNGFNTSGKLDIEPIAAVIESSNADVVGLQEISRGWLIWGNMDMLSWLSQRLGMPYFSGPTSDAQWGNAILSRYPIISTESYSLPTDELLIRRGFIEVKIDVGMGSLTVICTHFAHRGMQSEIRELQAREIIQHWNQSPSTVILGDFNASPDSTAMSLFSEHGLVNVAAELRPEGVLTSPSTQPSGQIDYIWASSDLLFSNLAIPLTQASDHLPVIATINLPQE